MSARRQADFRQALAFDSSSALSTVRCLPGTFSHTSLVLLLLLILAEEGASAPRQGAGTQR